MYPEQRGPTQETPPPYSGPPSQTSTEVADDRRRTDALGSDATRHLCAAAYIDDGFRDECLREVLHQRRRIVAPSYGFDLVTVLGHCQRARNIAIYRDAAILGLAVVTACLSASSLLVAIILLIELNVVMATYRLLRASFRQLRGGNLRIRSLMTSLWANALNVVASVVLLFIAYGIFTALSRDALVGAAFGQPDALLTASLGGILLFFVFMGLPVGAHIWRQAALDGLAPGRQPAPPGNSPRYAEINGQLGGNTVIYSGGEPFVGSGEIFWSWGFALRLVRANNDPLSVLTQTEADREFESPPFTGEELVNHLRGELEPLRHDRRPEWALPGLAIEDRIFLSGTETVRLSPWTSPEMISRVIRHPVAPARHYLAFQVVSWRGELVATVYVHVAVQGKSLYVELTSTVLTPCRPEYRIVDSFDAHGPLAYLRAIRRGLLDAPRTIGGAVGSLVRAGMDAIATVTRSTAAEALLPRGFDYGARESVRELGMEDDVYDHLQGQEILKHSRVVERRVMAAILDFLEAREVDIVEYRAQAANVLNVGAVNSGSGNMNIGPMQVGGQQNNNSAPRPRGAAPGPKGAS